MAERILQVYMAGSYAGNIIQNESGALSFTYSQDYAGVPLSVSMPPRNKAFGDKIVRPFLLGLLPDATSGDPFELLADAGFDCQGATQFVVSTAGVVPAAGVMPNSAINDLVELSDADIAERLVNAFQNNPCKTDSANAAAEHWSLSGEQTKFALRCEGDEWYSVTNTSATTHIFKAGNAQYKNEALNEYVCMKLAKHIGIPTASVEYRVFATNQGEPHVALIVKRFDRALNNDGRLVRVHFEDFCQACSIMPANRYAENGGPTINDIITILKRTGGGNKDSLAVSNILQFCAALFFNYLIGAIDAHAKNYGLMHLLANAGAGTTKGGANSNNASKSAGIPYVKFAPLYDAVSAFPYVDVENITLAMPIGGATRVGMLTRDCIEAFVQENGLTEFSQDGFIINTDNLCAYWQNLAQRVKNMLPVVFDEILAAFNPDDPKDLALAAEVADLQDMLMPFVFANCDQAIAALNK